MKQVAQTSRSIYEAMERDINHIILPQTYITLELIEEVDNLMSQCDIEYIDALHYAIAKKEGIKLIATLDSDYMNIPDPNLKILTDSENYQKLLARYGITITAANI